MALFFLLAFTENVRTTSSGRCAIILVNSIYGDGQARWCHNRTHAVLLLCKTTREPACLFCPLISPHSEIHVTVPTRFQANQSHAAFPDSNCHTTTHDTLWVGLIFS